VLCGFDRPYAGQQQPGTYPESQATNGYDHERARNEHHETCLRIIEIVGDGRIGEGLHGVPVDLAWRDPHGHQYIAEVKSCVAGNVTEQLRLGLGQILEYRHRLSQEKITTTGVLAVPHVYDRRWYAICADVDIRLIATDDPDDLHGLTTNHIPASTNGRSLRRH
jgi:hypothetical protein